MGAGTAAGPREPHTASLPLQSGSEQPRKEASFPKRRAQLQFTLPAQELGTGRGGGGFQGKDPAIQKPPIEFLARGGREGASDQ